MFHSNRQQVPGPAGTTSSGVNLLVCFSASGSGQRLTQSVEEDREEVFTVELKKGPHGLGLALVDGTVRPLPLGLIPTYTRLINRFHFVMQI